MKPGERVARWLERRSTAVLAIVACLGLILVLAAMEGVLAVMLAHSDRLPSGFLLDGVRSIYLREDWSIPQADLSVVAYDPELTYLLRPGPARFANREFDTSLAGNSAKLPRFVNREFDTTLAGNSQGLRDDETSLERPDLIVAGDSFSMGWGVEQDETYAQVLEQRTGLRVLNAAMSSYGTARQVILLERLDLSAARAVVVQYFMNDFEENRAFVDSGYTLAVTPETEFLESVRDFELQTRYRPLDYLKAFLDRRSYFPELETISPRIVAETCLRVLASSDELGHLPILFLQIDPWGRFGHHDVVAPIAELLESEPEYSDLRSHMTLISLEGVFTEGDLFRLDPHLRPRGHEKVAAEIERALRSAGLLN